MLKLAFILPMLVFSNLLAVDDFLCIKIKYSRRIISVYVTKYATILQLKQRIKGKTLFEANAQHLYHNNRELLNEETMESCELSDNSYVLLVF